MRKRKYGVAMFNTSGEMSRSEIESSTTNGALLAAARSAFGNIRAVYVTDDDGKKYKCEIEIRWRECK